MVREDIKESVYKFVCTFIAQRGYAPSFREIARACYISTAYVARCLDVLEAEGRLSREPSKARSIHLTTLDGGE